MANLIRRITAIRLTSDGANAVEIYRSRKKRRKVSRAAKPLDRQQRRMLKAQRTFADDLLNRYDRSSRKRKDGGLRDMMANVMRSQSKAMKRLRKAGN